MEYFHSVCTSFRDLIELGGRLWLTGRLALAGNAGDRDEGDEHQKVPARRHVRRLPRRHAAHTGPLPHFPPFLPPSLPWT